MPPAHRFVSDWSKENFLKWAREQIGDHAQEFCEGIFQRKDHPQQAYKACMGVLQLRKNYGKDRIEKACQRALAYNAISYHSLKSILERNLDQQPQNNTKSLTIPMHENIRGPQYYQ